MTENGGDSKSKQVSNYVIYTLFYKHNIYKYIYSSSDFLKISIVISITSSWGSVTSKMKNARKKKRKKL